jgi:hypothetical protein
LIDPGATQAAEDPPFCLLSERKQSADILVENVVI